MLLITPKFNKVTPTTLKLTSNMNFATAGVCTSVGIAVCDGKRRLAPCWTAAPPSVSRSQRLIETYLGGRSVALSSALFD